MDFTWSQGFERRKAASPKGKSRQPEGLPSIGGSSPLSASSPQRPLRASASEPSLTATDSRIGRRLSARERIQAFNERNDPKGRMLPDEKFLGRLSYAKLQREMALSSKAYDDAGFHGAKGIQGFRKYLITHCGSVVAGWRQLDIDKNGRLTYNEFFNACRRLGYHGNLKKLWGELDANFNGSVSLMEIDAEAGRYVGTFKLALIKEYGDMVTAWFEGLDTNHNGRIEQKEIDACCEKLGLELDTKKLFSMLTVGPTQLGMTLGDFDPEAYNRWLSGDVKGLAASSADTEFLEDLPGAEALPDEATRTRTEGGAKKWRAHLQAKTRAEVQANRQENTRFRLGMHSVAGFKRALICRCGSLYGAWREALDLDGNDRITWGEFNQAMHRLGFHGNIKGLWAELDPKKRGHILFADLDPQTDAQLRDLRAKLVEAHGNILLGWLKGLDSKGSGRVTQEMFVDACEKVGFSGDAENLFKVLQPDPHRRFLTAKDFDTRAYLAMSRGDYRMISEPEEARLPNDKKPTERSFTERQQMCFSYQIQRALQVAHREEYAKACRLKVPEHVIDTAEEFEFLCKRTYGSMIGAWRMCLDADGNGKLTFGELCQALRRLGYSGDYKALFRKYDTDNKGYVSLKEIDPKAEAIITSFLQLLGDKYGELEKGWRLGFGKDPHECIDEAGLKEACENLGFTQDAHKLFKCLQPTPGKQLITIWDLDPECTRLRQRGDPAFIATPKSPLSKPGRRSTFGQQGEPALDTSTASASAAADVANTTGASTALNASTTLNASSGHIEASIPLLELLRKSLRLKYGTTVAAWRCAFDPNFVGTAAFGKFTLVLDDCAFKGNRKATWQELITKQNPKRAHITFQDVDPEAQALLHNAREQLLGKFECLEEAWQKGLDAEGVGRLNEDDFLAAWGNMGLDASRAKRVFRALLTRQGQRSVGCEDLKVLLIGVPGPSRRAFWSGVDEQEAAPVASNGAGEEVNLNPILYAGFEQRIDAAALLPFLALRREDAGQGQAAEEPLELLTEAQVQKRTRAGSSFYERHPDSRERIEQALARAQPGWGVWVSPKHDLPLDAQFSLSVRTGAPSAQGPPLTTDQELQVLRYSTYPPLPEGPPRDEGRGAAEEPPPPESPAQAASPSQLDEASLLSALTLPRSPKAGTQYDLKFPAVDISMRNQNHHDQDKVVNSLAGFKRLLKEKYGSIYAGWRHILDVDRDGRVTLMNFADACRKLGIKATQRIWLELDLEKRGQVTLQELDPATGSAIAAFESFLKEKHMTTKKGWKEAFELNNTVLVDEKKFVAVCEKLGLEYDARAVFKLLRPEAGRPHLTYEDVWVDKDKTGEAESQRQEAERRRAEAERRRLEKEGRLQEAAEVGRASRMSSPKASRAGSPKAARTGSPKASPTRRPNRPALDVSTSYVDDSFEQPSELNQSSVQPSELDQSMQTGNLTQPVAA